MKVCKKGALNKQDMAKWLFHETYKRCNILFLIRGRAKVHPCYFADPAGKHPETYDPSLAFQYFFGADMVVAPITQPVGPNGRIAKKAEASLVSESTRGDRLLFPPQGSDRRNLGDSSKQVLFTARGRLGGVVGLPGAAHQAKAQGWVLWARCGFHQSPLEDGCDGTLRPASAQMRRLPLRSFLLAQKRIGLSTA